MVIALQTVLWRCSFPPDVCINGRPPPFSFHCIEQYCSHVVTQLSATSKHSTRRENTSVRAARENISVTLIWESVIVLRVFFFSPFSSAWWQLRRILHYDSSRPPRAPLLLCSPLLLPSNRPRQPRWRHNLISPPTPRPNFNTISIVSSRWHDGPVPSPLKHYPAVNRGWNERTGREEVSPRSVSGKNINSVFKSHSNNHRSYRDTDFSSL